MEPGEIKREKLVTSETGREWHLVECARPDSNLKEGKHFILEVVGQPPAKELTHPELTELRILAFQLADELASGPGRWRVDFNGEAVGTRPHFHCHIKLPKGADKLAQLVG